MIVYKASTRYQSCYYDDLNAIGEELEMLFDLDKKITIEKIEMSEEEYEKLPEFTGW